MTSKTRGTQSVSKENMKLYSVSGIVKKYLLTNGDIDFLKATSYVKVG